MRSVTGSPTSPPSDDGDRTARARIRDAAIACFADGGVDGTSVRAVATEADVSPALVMHHFGSKDGLRVACDQHVAELIRRRKVAAVGAGPDLDVVRALRSAGDGPPLLRYLARTLVDGSPHVASLVDELVADAAAYTEVGVAAGTLRPTDDPHGRAAVLTLWSLGALVLHEHVARVVGADLTGDLTDASGYLLPALEILGTGVLTEETAARATSALRGAAEEERP